jgi:hypothetical protein
MIGAVFGLTLNFTFTYRLRHVNDTSSSRRKERVMPAKKDTAGKGRNFKTTTMSDVPRGRNGKHKDFVGKLLADLTKLDDGQALKINVKELPQPKANIRSALNRATRKEGKTVSTAVDKDYLYVWNA